MAEFIGEEKLVSKGEHIFENKTDSGFDVGMGVIFHKSGIYEVSIVGNKTIVSKVGKPKIWPESDMTTHIILETLRECGIYGEEATIITTNVLKRIGRDDLLLPCTRRRRMKTKEQIQKETTIGDVFKTADFTEHIIDGLFIPYDGYGFFHDGEKNTDINVWDAATGEYRWDLAKTNKYPYVIWFNR